MWETIYTSHWHSLIFCNLNFADCSWEKSKIRLLCILPRLIEQVLWLRAIKYLIIVWITCVITRCWLWLSLFLLFRLSSLLFLESALFYHIRSFFLCTRTSRAFILGGRVLLKNNITKLPFPNKNRKTLPEGCGWSNILSSAYVFFLCWCTCCVGRKLLRFCCRRNNFRSISGKRESICSVFSSVHSASWKTSSRGARRCACMSWFERGLTRAHTHTNEFCFSIECIHSVLIRNQSVQKLWYKNAIAASCNLLNLC